MNRGHGVPPASAHPPIPFHTTHSSGKVVPQHTQEFKGLLGERGDRKALFQGQSLAHSYQNPSQTELLY